MSYLAFKEKMNSIRQDEIRVSTLVERAEFIGVTAFWIIFTVGLLGLGYIQEHPVKAISPDSKSSPVVFKERIPMPEFK